MAEEVKPKVEIKKFIIQLPNYLEYNPGYIYAIRVGDHIKIGRTWSHKRRLEYYASFPPFEYEILLLESVPDSKFFERAIQLAFIEFQVKGEWFDMPKYDMDFRAEIKTIFNKILMQVKDNDVFDQYWKLIRKDYARWRKTHSND